MSHWFKINVRVVGLILSLFLIAWVGLSGYVYTHKVTISPMEIKSSVLNIFLSGVYSFGKGTDIGLKIPLRNLRKDELISDMNQKARVPSKA